MLGVSPDWKESRQKLWPLGETNEFSKQDQEGLGENENRQQLQIKAEVIPTGQRKKWQYGQLNTDVGCLKRLWKMDVRCLICVGNIPHFSAGLPFRVVLKPLSPSVVNCKC